jgi:hypothetical protein
VRCTFTFETSLGKPVRFLPYYFPVTCLTMGIMGLKDYDSVFRFFDFPNLENMELISAGPSLFIILVCDKSAT